MFAIDKLSETLDIVEHTESKQFHKVGHVHLKFNGRIRDTANMPLKSAGMEIPETCKKYAPIDALEWWKIADWK